MNYNTASGTITVEVQDTIIPAAIVSVGTNAWTEFFNNLTFGLFFKETQKVTITAEDSGSGMDGLYYYLAEKELTEDELKAITDWKTYSESFNINPDKKYVVYAKAADKSGNMIYVNTDGIILDATAPAIGLVDGGTYYGDCAFTISDALAGMASVVIDGEEVSVSADNHYTIIADNQEHTIMVTDNAGNVTEYKVTVYKVYTVIFMADGKEVNSVSVNHGSAAEALEIPAKIGYTQTAPYWDKAFDNVTSDMTVNAVYTINKYTVSVPETQIGYMLTVDKAETEHGGEVKLTYALAEGYSETSDFAVKVNDFAIDFMNGEYTISNVAEDITITVQGVADITAPTAEITIGTNRWNKFWNSITFGLFFKDT